VRSAALVIPDLGLQLAARRAGAVPGEAAAVLVERDAGVERVRAVTARARAAGVVEGETVARARSLVPGLLVWRPELGEESATLDALAEALGPLSPAVERRPPGTLLLDASVAGLVRFPREGGAGEGEAPSLENSAEARWTRAVRAPTLSLGLSGHVVVADTPAAARLFAMHAALSGGAPVRLVPPRAQSALLGPLPIGLVEALAGEVRVLGASTPDDAALELSSATFRWLESLRLRTLADLRRLPPRTLSTRLGAEAERLLFWASGGRERPMDVLRLSPVLEESVAFEPPLKESGGLLFALGPLLERLALRAKGRGRTVTTLSVECALDLFESTADGPSRRATESWEVRAAKPTAEAGTLRELLRGRLERWRARAPVVQVRLSVSALSDRREQLVLGERPRALEALGGALGRLRERLGAQSVGLLVERDRHVPEQTTAAAPFEEARGRPRVTVESSQQEEGMAPLVSDAVSWPAAPLKLFAPEETPHEADEAGRPRRLRFRGDWRVVVAFSPPVRLSTGWHEAPMTRDYRTALLADGTRLWLYVGPDGRLWAQGVHD
jgi:protein ImuB